jgi:hypothetical protein
VRPEFHTIISQTIHIHIITTAVRRTFIHPLSNTAYPASSIFTPSPITNISRNGLHAYSLFHSVSQKVLAEILYRCVQCEAALGVEGLVEEHGGGGYGAGEQEGEDDLGFGLEGMMGCE